MNLIRREIKFQISMELAIEIQKYIEPYCTMDKYSQIEPDNYYTINSLYLDSPSMYLLEQKRNDRVRRFSVRIRSYGDSPDFPVFIEKKKRIDGFIHKIRTHLNSESQIQYLNGLVPQEISPLNANLSHFCFDIISLGLRPQIMTRYQRLAYMGNFDNYSRVTFDKNLRYYREDEYNVLPDRLKFNNYDHQEQYEETKNNIILELKCESKIPVWMNFLIQKFHLRQKQFSKFDSSWTYLTDNDPLTYLQSY